MKKTRKTVCQHHVGIESGVRHAERVSGLERREDRDEAMEMIVKSFPDSPQMAIEMPRARYKGIAFDPGLTRVVVADGRVVSAVVMAPRSVRFGSVLVPAMTVGPVATRTEYRGKGYCAVAMNDATREMRKRGVLLAYLAGSCPLYARFGYFRFMVVSLGRVRVADADREALPGRLRRMTRADLPRVAELYERANKGRIMSAARDAALWQWLLTCGVHSWLFPSPKVIVDDQHRVRGYVTFKKTDGMVVEEIIVPEDEASSRVAMGALSREARSRKLEEFVLAFSWNSPLGLFLRRLVGVQVTMHNRNAGPLLKIVDFPALMRALRPLFAQRLKASGARFSGVRFNLASEIGAAGFEVAGNKINVGEAVRGERVCIPQYWLSGLITGYWSVQDVMHDPKVKLSARLRPLMEIVFPAGWPYAYRGDNY
ncbi:MAG: hypothetical protein C0404_06795 [Verrucomicrobia bacterium]|nr:hypothetical protein [Verrucomicrobiota bacterium]